MAHCSACGATLTEGANFCARCAEPVASGTVTPAVPTPPKLRTYKNSTIAIMVGLIIVLAVIGALTGSFSEDRKMGRAGCAGFVRAIDTFTKTLGYSEDEVDQRLEFNRAEFWLAAVGVARDGLESTDPVFRKAAVEMTDAIHARDLSTYRAINDDLSRQCAPFVREGP